MSNQILAYQKLCRIVREVLYQRLTRLTIKAK